MCQEPFGQYSQGYPDTQRPAEHRSQVPTPLQYFLEAGSDVLRGSLGKQVTAMSSVIYMGDDQTGLCYSFSLLPWVSLPPEG